MIQQLIVNGETILPLLNGSALVASRSHEGGWHAVKVIKGVRCCNCPAGQHGRSCRHVRAVASLAASTRSTGEVETPNTLTGATIWAAEPPAPPRPAQDVSFAEVFGMAS